MTTETKRDKRPAWAKAGDHNGVEVTRTDLYWFPPESLLIAGIDSPADPTDPLYDERIELRLQAMFVANVDQLGVKQTVTCVVKDGRLWVADGRQRVRAARAANVLRAQRGDTPLKVRACSTPETNPQEVFLLARSLNAFRQDDGPLTVARNFLRSRDTYGTSPDEYATAENIAVATLAGYVTLLERASPVLLQALDAGEVSTTRAMQVARLNPEDQAAAIVETMRDTVEETRRKVRERKASAEGKTATTRFTGKEIRRVATALTDGGVPNMPGPAKALLQALNGEPIPEGAPAWLAAVFAAAGRGDK